MRYWSWWVGGLLWLASASGRADTLQSNLFGSRTASMGGAAVAAGRDSAMPVLNPAGVANVSRTTFSLSTSLYGASLADVPSFNASAGEVDTRYGRGSISQEGLRSSTILTVPSSLAFFHSLEALGMQHTVAASLTVPRSSAWQFVQATDVADGSRFAVRDDTTYLASSTRYLAALTDATRVGDTRVGVSVLASYSAVAWTFSQRSFGTFSSTRDVHNVSIDESFQGSSADLAGAIGVQQALTPALSVGLAVQTPSVHLRGRLDQFATRASWVGVMGEVNGQVSKSRLEGNFTDGLPLRVAAGVAYEAPDSFGLALDVHLYHCGEGRLETSGRQQDSEIFYGTSPRDVSREVRLPSPQTTLVNVAVGAEVRVGAKSWLRGGVFTDFSTDPSPPARAPDPARCSPFSATYDASGCPSSRHVLAFPFDKLGVALGYGRLSGPVETTVGLAARFGTGDTGRASLREATPVYSTTGATTYEVQLFLGGVVDVWAEEKVSKLEGDRERLERANEALLQRQRQLEREAAAARKAAEKAPVEPPPAPPPPPKPPEPPPPAEGTP